MDDISEFLETSGLLHGCVPSLKGGSFYWQKPQFQARFFGNIALVADPVHAVCLGITKDSPKGYLAGVTIGKPTGMATIPDILLGFIDGSGAWVWAAGYGEIINLHSFTGFEYPQGDVWPVWLTFGDCKGLREHLLGASTSPSMDISENLRRRTCRRFWEASKEEFIRTSWAPHRLRWCLDTDEYRDFFSAA